MIYSIDLQALNRMSRQKMLFGDGTCEVCGSDELTSNIGAKAYCCVCFANLVDNKNPEVPGEDSE